MRWKLVFLVVLALAIFGFIRIAHFHPADELTVGDTSINIQIADTPEEREQGLSDRPSLADTEGLLFVFDTPSNYGFWMKDMNFPIDIIWIREEGTIVGVERAVSPHTYPEIFYPPEPVKFVLEVTSGFADRHSVSAGQRLSIGQ